MGFLRWFLIFSFLWVPAGGSTPGPLHSNNLFKSIFEGWHREQILNSRIGTLEKNEIIKKLKSSYIKEEVEVALNIHSPGRPLIVLIPGLFGNYDNVESHSVGQILYEQGYNLLRFPNPVSRYVIRKQPNYGALDFESEGAFYSDLVKQVQAEYRFPKVHFTGISYGAFISSVTATKMGDGFKGKLLLISPPKNILTSLTVIDAYFDELKLEFKKFPFKQIALMASVYWKGFWGETVVATEEDAKSTLIIYGFHKTFIELSDMRDQALNPRPLWQFYERWSAAAKQKQSEMRFIPYLKEVNPHFFKDPEKHEIHYWIKKSGGEWLLLTAPDDFINRDPNWSGDSRIKNFEGGGHVFGFMNRPDYRESLTGFFPKLD